MNDPKTADALAALKKQENLARRSSVRRASALYRSTSSASTRANGRPRLASDASELIPPVPMVPEQEKEMAFDHAPLDSPDITLNHEQVADVQPKSDLRKELVESKKSVIGKKR